MIKRYDEWKEQGMDDWLDGMTLCDACQKDLHQFCGELDEPCECECSTEQDNDE